MSSITEPYTNQLNGAKCLFHLGNSFSHVPGCQPTLHLAYRSKYQNLSTLLTLLPGWTKNTKSLLQRALHVCRPVKRRWNQANGALNRCTQALCTQCLLLLGTELSPSSRQRHISGLLLWDKESVAVLAPLVEDLNGISLLVPEDIEVVANLHDSTQRRANY